jgi:hypothetical protein
MAKQSVAFVTDITCSMISLGMPDAFMWVVASPNTAQNNAKREHLA